MLFWGKAPEGNHKGVFRVALCLIECVSLIRKRTRALHRAGSSHSRALTLPSAFSHTSPTLTGLRSDALWWWMSSFETRRVIVIVVISRMEPRRSGVALGFRRASILLFL